MVKDEDSPAPSPPRRRDPQIDADNLIGDPDTVMSRGLGAGAHPEIQQMLLRGEEAPRTGEALARALARLYGPFTAASPAENRRAIIANLLWIADIQTGIQFEPGRAASGGPRTYPPNHTLSVRRGVCRDIHTAIAALLAALIGARRQDDHWVPGPPTGQEAWVQTIGFANPDEYHAYLVYRDPGTGGWNAIEYGMHYALGAPNAVDAFRNLPGYVPGYHRYTLRGWDQHPAVSDRGEVGAARANRFFEDDPGTGAPGELRLSAAPDDIRLTYFTTPRLSLVGSIDPSGNSLRGGLKLNYHRDLERIGDSARGHLHAAGGVYTDFFDARSVTGMSGADGRTRYHLYALGMQFDGRIQTDPYDLLGDHLKLKLGGDWNLRLGLPLTSGGRQGFGLPVGAMMDFSAADVGGDVRLTGSERLSDKLRVDWAIGARAEVDLIGLTEELVTSGGSAERNLLRNPVSFPFTLALVHQADSGAITRFEVGGTQLLMDPYDPQTTATGSHYAALSISPGSGEFNFGLLARGQSIDDTFLPVTGLGVVLDLRPSDRIRVGLGVETALPGGDWKKIGDRLMVRGNLSIDL